MASAREKLLRAAGQRFYADGITATGVDAIVAEAGVAKMSLYNNFASKQELVVTYLERRHEEWLGFLAARLAASAGPDERVLAVFDAYLDHAALHYEGGFRGCGGLNGAAELPVGHPGREAVRRHKNEVRQILAGLCAEAGVESPDRVAGHLFLLVEGGVVSAGLSGNSERLLEAREVARSVLALATPSAPPGTQSPR